MLISCMIITRLGYPEGMCLTLSATIKMNNTYYGKCKVYFISESIQENSYDQGVMDTGIHKTKYHWAEVYLSITIKVIEDNIAILYTMIDYRLKVIHDDDDTLHLFPRIQNSNAYTKEENNCGDDSIMFLPYDGHMGDTVISENTDLSSNKIPESIY